MAEKGIKDEIYYAIFQYVKANNKYMNNYEKNKESPYIKYFCVNNLYGWAMSQRVPVGGFEKKNNKNWKV